MNRFKRCLTFFLVLSLVLGSMPVNASTADMPNSEVELPSIENLQENLTSEDDSAVGISLSDSLIQLEVGDTYTLTYELLPDDTDLFDLEWLSSDVEIAVVDDGLVTAVAEGEVEITAHSAEDESIAAVCVVEVVPAAVLLGETNEEITKGFAALAATSSGSCTCGSHVSSSFNTSTGELIFSGSGIICGYDPVDGHYPTWAGYGDKVKTIIINEGITGIGGFGSPFPEYINLTSVSIPNSVEYIAPYAFSGCSKLADVSLPTNGNLDDISLGSFYGCSGLTTLRIPSSVTEIGQNAFQECVNLRSVYFEGNAPEVYSASSIITDPDYGLEYPAATFEKDIVTLYYQSGKTGWTSPTWQGYNTATYGVTNAATPTITTQPSDITVNIGGTATLRVVASVSGSISYQWYRNTTRNNKDGTPIIGETKATYTAPTNNPVVYYYYCVVTNTDNTATGNKTASIASNAARVTANPLPTRVVVNFGKQNNKMEINWRNDYFNSSATEYNHDLAIASLVLADAAYSYSGVKKTLEDLGFTDVSRYEYDDDNFFNAGHAIAKKEIGNNTVIAIAIRGTPSLSGVFEGEGGALEWLNGILGWINGASVTVDSNLQTYLSNLDYPQNVKLWITGHSRGAAVSNCIGAPYSDGIYGQNNVFSYGFASPNTVNLLARGNYKNIYSFKNTHDYLVTNTPVLMGKYGEVIGFTPNKTAKDHYTQLTGKNYDSFVSAVNPFSGSAHSTEIYMAHLLRGRTVSEKQNSRTIIVRCPVDIEVYNGSGKLVGRVINDAIDSDIDQEVIIWLDGDEKYIYLPPEGAFSFKIVGTDDGTMNFHVGYTDMNSWDVLEEKAFQNVSLFSGKQMTSNVSSTADISDARLFIIDNNVIVSEVMEDGTEKAVFTITAIAGAGGKVSGGGIYATDDPVTLTATPKTNYTFDGWYENGTIISEADSTYSFTAAVNRTIEAKFKYATSGNTGGGGGIFTSTCAATFETNGGSAIAKVKVNEGDKLSKPVDPIKDGFIFAGWFTDKELTKEYDFATLVTDNFTLYAKWTKEDKVIPEPEWTNPFTDVKPSDWFYDPVQYAITNGLFYGTSATIFAPNDTMTRAMLVTVLWRSAGSPAASDTPFTDVQTGQWYSDAVTWAAQSNIVSGIGNGLFAPNAKITREQMAVMLYNYSRHINIKLPQKRSGTFMDETQISPWAKEAVAAMYAAEIINGKAQNNFDPQGDATRAEVATMMRNFLEIIGR